MMQQSLLSLDCSLSSIIAKGNSAASHQYFKTEDQYILSSIKIIQWPICTTSKPTANLIYFVGTSSINKGLLPTKTAYNGPTGTQELLTCFPWPVVQQ